MDSCKDRSKRKRRTCFSRAVRSMFCERALIIRLGILRIRGRSKDTRNALGTRKYGKFAKYVTYLLWYSFSETGILITRITITR